MCKSGRCSCWAVCATPRLRGRTVNNKPLLPRQLLYFIHNYLSACVRLEKEHYYRLPWQRGISCMTSRERRVFGVVTSAVPTLSDLCTFKSANEICGTTLILFKIITEFPLVFQWDQFNTDNRHQLEFMWAVCNRIDTSYGNIKFLSFREEVLRHEEYASDLKGGPVDMSLISRQELMDAFHTGTHLHLVSTPFKLRQ